MPRRSSSGGRSSARSSARPVPRSAGRSSPPQKANSAPPPAPVKRTSGDQSVLGSIGSAIADGMSFGTGNAIAHRVMDALMGPRTIRHEPVATAPAPAAAPAVPSTMSDACTIHSKAFEDCLNGCGEDISKCQFYMNLLTECRKNSGPVPSS